MSLNLSSPSRCAIAESLKQNIATHHFLRARIDNDPSYQDIASVYADGYTCVGYDAAEMLNDLGGMAAAW